MKKIYTIIALSSLIFSANAQQGSRKASKHEAATAVALKNGPNSNQVLVCDTITQMTATDSLFLYTAGTNTTTGLSHGYVAGNNDYGDLKKATFFEANLYPVGSTITGVLTQFYKASASKGTHGTGTVTMEIFGGDTTAGPSATVVGSSPATLTAIGASTFTVGNSLFYNFPFASIAAPAAGFFASLTLPTAAGDTAVLFNVRDMSMPARNYAWENYGAWGSFRADWGLPTKLSMYPVICYNSSGVHHNVLDANMSMYPNPSNGQFNFVMALPESTNLTVSITNTLGQVVYTKTENNFKAGILNYDLTSLNKGVYFANITDSNNNKVVRKIIIE